MGQSVQQDITRSPNPRPGGPSGGPTSLPRYLNWCVNCWIFGLSITHVLASTATGITHSGQESALKRAALGRVVALGPARSSARGHCTSITTQRCIRCSSLAQSEEKPLVVIDLAKYPIQAVPPRQCLVERSVIGGTGTVIQPQLMLYGEPPASSSKPRQKACWPRVVVRCPDFSGKHPPK